MPINTITAKMLLLKSLIILSCNITSIVRNHPVSDTVRVTSNSFTLTKLPFGCPILIKHKFPKSWDIPLDDKDSIKTTVNPHEQALQAIADFYQNLIHIQSIKRPIIKHLQFLPIGYDARLRPYERRFKAIYKYQLPNIGPYECFYQYFDVPMAYYYKQRDKAFAHEKLFEDKLFKEYGNLVLYDTKTKEGKIINIYNSYSYRESTVAMSRYFYIDVAGKIQIFEASQGESGESIRKTNEVEIKSDGRVVIKMFK